MKQLEIIQTKNYLVAVSDEEFSEGDNVIDNVKRIWLKMESCFVKVAKNSTYGKSYKIIAHLPLNNSPVLEGVALLPEIRSEEDMIEFTEWIVEKWTPNGRRGCWDSRELNSKFEPKYLVDSTKQLLQIWKEQKIKNIYYEN